MWTPIGRSLASLRPFGKTTGKNNLERLGNRKRGNGEVVKSVRNLSSIFFAFHRFSNARKRMVKLACPSPLLSHCYHTAPVHSCTRTHSVPSLVSLIPHLLMSSLIDIMGDYANSAACADTLLLLLTLQCLLYQNMCFILYSYVRHYNLVYT